VDFVVFRNNVKTKHSCHHDRSFPLPKGGDAEWRDLLFDGDYFNSEMP